MMVNMLDAMLVAALAPAKALHLQADGRLVRCRVKRDKPGSRNGRAVLPTSVDGEG